jgi:hypothetical protein
MFSESLTGAAESELMWDVGGRGTAFVGDGSSIPIAGADGWSPELLLATGAAAMVMRRFLERAAEERLEILGYVSRQRLLPPARAEVPGIEICPCVVVASETAAVQAQRVFEAAVAGGSAFRLLAVQPVIDLRVNVVHDPVDRHRARPH